MRVLLATHQYLPNWIGGTELLVRGLARRLKRDGHEAVIATYEESASNNAADYIVSTSLFDGVEVFRIAYNLSCAPEPSLAEHDNEHTARSFSRILDETRPDVVHVASAMKLSGAIFAAIEARRIPIVTTLCDYWYLCLRHTLLKPDDVLCSGPDERYKCLHCAAVTHGFAAPEALNTPETQLSKLARSTEFGRSGIGSAKRSTFARDVRNIAERTPNLHAALLRSDRIVALSEFTRDLHVRFGVPQEKINVVRHGPEDRGLATIKAQRKSCPAGPLEIVCIATLASFKGVHILAEAFTLAPELDGTLLLYGPAGPDHGYVERLRELCARDKRIRLAGTFAPERIGELLSTAGVLAHPSIWYENDPQVIKQALLAGVPVAASDLGSLPETLAGVEGCTLLPPGDVSAWADWLRGLIEHPPPRTIEAPPLPTMEDFYRQMLSIFEELDER